MPHFVIKNPNDRIPEASMCIDRETQTCTILMTSVEAIETLLSVARAQKIPLVQIVVLKEVAPALIEAGWKVPDNLVVLTRSTTRG